MRNGWNLFDSWLIVDSSRIQLLICLIQPHCWFNQQPSRSGRSEIVFRFTVDSSKTQLLYSSTWLIHSADNCKTWKKRPSVTKTLTGQIKRWKSIFNISMQRVKSDDVKELSEGRRCSPGTFRMPALTRLFSSFSMPACSLKPWAHRKYSYCPRHLCVRDKHSQHRQLASYKVRQRA